MLALAVALAPGAVVLEAISAGAPPLDPNTLVDDAQGGAVVVDDAQGGAVVVVDGPHT